MGRDGVDDREERAVLDQLADPGASLFDRRLTSGRTRLRAGVIAGRATAKEVP